MNKPSGEMSNEVTTRPPLNPGKTENATTNGMADNGPTLLNYAQSQASMRQGLVNAILGDQASGGRLLNVMPLQQVERMMADNQAAAAERERERVRLDLDAVRNRVDQAVEAHAAQMARALNRRINERIANEGNNYEYPAIRENTMYGREAIIYERHLHILPQLLVQLGIRARYQEGAYRAVRAAARRHGWPILVRSDIRDGSFQTIYNHTRLQGPSDIPGPPRNQEATDRENLERRRLELARRINELGMTVAESNMVTDGDYIWGNHLLSFSEPQWQQVLGEIPLRFMHTYPERIPVGGFTPDRHLRARDLLYRRETM